MTSDITVTLKDIETIEWGNREEALRDICGAWELAVKSGWMFVTLLEKGCSKFTHDQEGRMNFLGEVANQTHVTVKRLQNLLSLARNESALTAREYGLEVGHGDVLARIADPEEAVTYAALAAEQSWSVADLRMYLKKDEDAPLAVAVLTLEIEEGSLIDDVCARLAQFIRSNWGEDGINSMREWLAD